MSLSAIDRVRSGPHRDDLCRTAAFTLTRAEAGDTDSDGLSIEGYGAVFNSVTEIDSWEGSFEEEILPGAFRKSLRERTPRMQYDHGRHPLLGSLPLGRWDVAEEDSQGLHVVGRLTDNWLVQPFRDAIAAGAVDGMSFRFSVVRDQWFDAAGKKLGDAEVDELLWRPGDRGPLRRKLVEVKASEVGPVTWPAYEETSVGVRDVDGRRAVVIDLARLTNGQSDERARLARLIALADRATGGTAGDISQPKTPDSSPSGQHDTEPRPTERSADEHPPPVGAPPVTDRSAGEHSSTAETEQRRARMRARAAEVKAAMSKIRTS